MIKMKMVRKTTRLTTADVPNDLLLVELRSLFSEGRIMAERDEVEMFSLSETPLLGALRCTYIYSAEAH